MFKNLCAEHEVLSYRIRLEIILRFEFETKRYYAILNPQPSLKASLFILFYIILHLLEYKVWIFIGEISWWMISMEQDRYIFKINQVENLNI